MTATEARAREIVHHQLTIEHEAAHAAAAVVLGLAMSEVRVDRPDATAQGRVTIHGAKAFPREAALVILSGPLSDLGTPDLRWPLPDDDQATSDERHLRQLVVAQLGYGKAEWDRLVSDTWRLVTRRDFCVIESVFTSLLEQWPVIEGELLKTVINCIRHNNPSEEKDRAA